MESNIIYGFKKVKYSTFEIPSSENYEIPSDPALLKPSHDLSMSPHISPSFYFYVQEHLQKELVFILENLKLPESFAREFNLMYLSDFKFYDKIQKFEPEYYHMSYIEYYDDYDTTSNADYLSIESDHKRGEPQEDPLLQLFLKKYGEFSCLIDIEWINDINLSTGKPLIKEDELISIQQDDIILLECSLSITDSNL